MEENKKKIIPVKIIKPQKIKKKTRKALDHYTEIVSWFLGSWWAVAFHTVWFGSWLIFDFDINILTLGVSLEAIFIGIFLLMASNKAEIERDIKELKQRQQDRERLERDIKLDEKADRQLTEIKRVQKEIREEMIKVRRLLRKLHEKTT